MKRKIDRGRIKFVLVKAKLRSYVYGVSTEKDMLMTPCRCPFGHWLEGVKKELGVSREIADLSQYHNEIHEEAINLTTLYDLGKVSEAQNGLDLFNEIAAKIEATLEKIVKNSLVAER